MKKSFLVTSLMLLGVLSACGGGGENAGDASEFSVSPNEWKVTYVDNESCTPSVSSPPTKVVTIIGGQAPFRIHNSSPAQMFVDRTEASGKDPVFVITLRGGCMEDNVITVLDYHSRVATIAVTAENEDSSN